MGIYPPEQLKAMTPAQINALIERDIREDAWERQRQQPVAFRGKRRAEGLEKLLYLCPRCKKIGTLRTRGDRISCGCGLDLRFEETGLFAEGSPFPDLARWADWQREELRARRFPHGETLFSDGGARLLRIDADHGETEIARGTLLQTETELRCGDQRFPLGEISNMAAVLTSRLLFTWNDSYYEILGGEGCNILKYLQVWRDR